MCTYVRMYVTKIYNSKLLFKITSYYFKVMTTALVMFYYEWYVYIAIVTFAGFIPYLYYLQ